MSRWSKTPQPPAMNSYWLGHLVDKILVAISLLMIGQKMDPDRRRVLDHLENALRETLRLRAAAIAQESR